MSPQTPEMSSLYEDLVRIRLVEQRLSSLFADNKIPGFIHSSLGQEAASVGILRALQAQDTLASNHRGHGHALTKGVDLAGFFAEVMGREAGCCRGRGGSMHVADAAVGMLGANGIVGAGLSIALGSALAHQINKTGGIAVVFFGDGALCEGLLHECLNMAQLWRLPMVFACENNGWSEFTPTAREFTSDICTLAQAFGIESRSVDGNDVLAVLDAALNLTAIARAGRPVVLEARTARVGGHFEGDQQRYRDASDIEAAKASDPIVRFEKILDGAGIDKAARAKIRAKVTEEIDLAVSKAMQSPEPAFADAFADVYSRAAAA